jgi:hypothetical protein
MNRKRDDIEDDVGGSSEEEGEDLRASAMDDVLEDEGEEHEGEFEGFIVDDDDANETEESRQARRRRGRGRLPELHQEDFELIEENTGQPPPPAAAGPHGQRLADEKEAPLDLRRRRRWRRRSAKRIRGRASKPPPLSP